MVSFTLPVISLVPWFNSWVSGAVDHTLENCTGEGGTVLVDIGVRSWLVPSVW